MADLIHISIIFPIYNEVKNLQKGVLDKVLNYARSQKNVIEVLIVDDGSTDESLSILKKEYIGKYPKLHVLEKKHSGKAFSVIAGIKHAKGNIVLFSDIDLATPIEEAQKLIDEIVNGCDIVIGSRTKERQGAPLIRKFMAYGFILFRSYLIGLPTIRDTQCGFKAFKKKAALDTISHLKVYKKELELDRSSVSAGFDLEFLFVAHKLGYKIQEVPVIWRHVETKNVNFLTDSFEAIRDLFRVKLNYIRGKYS
ncbi:MAG: glycosyltransferase [Candidatus Roizmanbacteria bacterium]|nr:glycosyltransferase [Candidatus Roizmanbacteria bacterium]